LKNETGLRQYVSRLNRGETVASVEEILTKEDEQVEFIKEQGGKYVQGYYFYKPMPPEEFEGLLEEKRKSGACL